VTGLHPPGKVTSKQKENISFSASMKPALLTAHWPLTSGKPERRASRLHGTAALVLFGIACAASLVTSLRASGSNPVRALHHE